MDLEISPGTVKELKAAGIADRVKTKENYLEGAPYLTFKQAELKRDGSPNKPIEIVDILGKPWNQDTLIGNGSVVDVKFVVMDFGPGKKKGVYIRGVRVLDLVPYYGGSFGALDEEDEYFAKARAAAESSSLRRQRKTSTMNSKTSASKTNPFN